MTVKVEAAVRKAAPGATPFLLGYGVLLAWAQILVASVGVDRTGFNTGLLSFDVGSVPVYLVAACAARLDWGAAGRLAPRVATGVMIAGNLLVCLASRVLGASGPAVWVSLGVSGLGFALATLCWMRLFVVLGPAQVALCCAGSVAVREASALFLSGYRAELLPFAALALPPLAALMHAFAQDRQGAAGLEARVSHGAASFPWKPLLFVGVYTFGYGCGTWLLRYEDDVWRHLGDVLPALVVCASVLAPLGKFRFPGVYRAIPLVACASLGSILLFSHLGTGIITVVVRASWTAVFIYATVVLCGLARRYRMNPTWLFGLFGLAQIVPLGMGTVASSVLSPQILVALCAASMLAVVYLTLSELDVSSDWSVSFAPGGALTEESVRIEIAVGTLAASKGLSARERQVLELLASGNTPRAIGNLLGIAPGTAKAHVQHVYRKLGVHDRGELLDMLGVSRNGE